MESVLHDIAQTPLYHLLTELQQLVLHVNKRGALRIYEHASSGSDKVLNKSVVNLAQYLALRELDLRPLQERLAEAGLSSLGRANRMCLPISRMSLTCSAGRWGIRST